MAVMQTKTPALIKLIVKDRVATLDLTQLGHIMSCSFHGAIVTKDEQFLGREKSGCGLLLNRF